MRKLILSGCIPAFLLLSGCGGGSGSIITPTSNNGSGGGNQAANVVTMTVDSGPNGNDVDTPFITVTVCAPGSTTNCQQIDHVEVDTGSFGLRIMSSVLSPSLAAALQQEVSTQGKSVVECTQFADGYSWGPVKVADVQIAGESASSVPIQVIGDPAYEQTSTAPEIPATCSSAGPQEDTVASFGANGIIGIGVFADDCGGDCTLTPGAGGNPSNPGFYYECPAASAWSATANPCSEIAISEAAQVTDPVTLFPMDNNGVIVELQPAAEGAGSDTGALIFGIGTAGNNSVGAQTVLPESAAGTITTTYTARDGTPLILPYSYFDTGSNAYYFADDSIPSFQGCSSNGGYNSTSPDSWFCPNSELSLQATNAGVNGAQSTVYFSIGNAYARFGSYPSGSVFDDLGADSNPQPKDCSSQTTDTNCAFDFGFPFFLGRSVYIAFVGANTAWGTGPYVAY